MVDAVKEVVEQLGAMGYAIFALAYVAGVLLLIPEWIFTVVAGALFGMVGGLALSWAAALAASFVAFFLARHGLRHRIEKHVKKNRWLAAVNKALPKEGWKVVALTRMSPVPFGLQNYFFGVTKVKRRDYVLATAVAIAPATAIQTFLGATGWGLFGESHPATWALFIAGVIAMIVLTWLLTRIARRRLGLEKRSRGG